MSTILEAKDGEVYTGYTNLTGSRFCDTLSGLNFCYAAEVENGKLVLATSFKFPFTITREFEITQNSSFAWNVGFIGLNVTITNFTHHAGRYSFDGVFKISVSPPQMPVNTKTFSHHFDVGGQLLKAHTELTDAEFTNMLILQLLLNEAK